MQKAQTRKSIKIKPSSVASCNIISTRKDIPHTSHSPSHNLLECQALKVCDGWGGTKYCKQIIFLLNMNVSYLRCKIIIPSIKLAISEPCHHNNSNKIILSFASYANKYGIDRDKSRFY